MTDGIGSKAGEQVPYDPDRPTGGGNINPQIQIDTSRTTVSGPIPGTRAGKRLQKGDTGASGASGWGGGGGFGTEPGGGIGGMGGGPSAQPPPQPQPPLKAAQLEAAQRRAQQQAAQQQAALEAEADREFEDFMDKAAAVYDRAFKKGFEREIRRHGGTVKWRRVR